MTNEVMYNIEPEDMVEALNQNPLAMEQAKVAALTRENIALRIETEQLKASQSEDLGPSDGS